MNSQNFKRIVIPVVIFLFFAVGLVFYLSANKAIEVRTFEECMARKGSIVMMTYPRVCSAKTGNKISGYKSFVFTEQVTITPTNIPTPTSSSEIISNYESCMRSPGSKLRPEGPTACETADGKIYFEDTNND